MIGTFYFEKCFVRILRWNWNLVIHRGLNPAQISNTQTKYSNGAFIEERNCINLGISIEFCAKEYNQRHIISVSHARASIYHADVIKWKHFPRYWPFVRGIHRPPVNSLHKGQWHGALMFSLICVLKKRLRKQSWGWWFETLSRPLCRHCNVFGQYSMTQVIAALHRMHLSSII